MSDRHYSMAPTVADLTAYFPTSVMPAIDVRDEDLDGYAVTDLDVTGWELLEDGSYGRYLDQVPLTQDGFTAVDQADSQALTVQEWGEAPADTDICIDWNRGRFAIHANRAAHTIRFNFTGRGTDITGPLLNRIQKELIAVETTASAAPMILQGLFLGAPAITTSGWEHRFIVPGATGATMRLKGIQVFAADPSDAADVTSVRVSTVVIGGSGSTATATLGSTDKSTAVSTCNITFTAGDTVYVFVTAAGGHQNIQYKLEFRPV